MIGLRIANIAKKIAEDIENKYVYDPDHENKPQDGGNWHETPQGWSTYDVENRKFNDDEEINKETTIRIRNVDSDEEFSTIISKARERLMLEIDGELTQNLPKIIKEQRNLFLNMAGVLR